MRRRPRTAPAAEACATSATSTVDPVAREVRSSGTVELTKIEFDILDLLSGVAAPHLHPRAQLLTTSGAASGTATTTSSTCTWATCARSSASRPPTQRHIRTVRGVGYRFDPS